ncbi:MAG: hypothetical protein HFJ29_05770 [Clostridia bacterium]|nr:hypothetical protein [Clostridia bacterium]
MTVKTELERLKKQKEGLEKDRNKEAKELEAIIRERNSLEDKRRELEGRTSTLAQKLQHANKIDLALKEKSILEKEKVLRDMEAELQRIQEGIDARENDTTLYIQEQVHLMVPQFLEWVAKNKEAIGYDITRSFYVAGVVAWNNAYDVDCYTGDVGIFDKGDYPAVETIVCSENFYFNQTCSIVEDDRRYGRNVKKTDWYAKYLEDFTKALLEELEAAYNLGEELKLTIASPSFTLELV